MKSKPRNGYKLKSFSVSKKNDDSNSANNRQNTTASIQNASWIIGAKIAQSCIGIVVSMLTARYLGPSNYGLINYAASIVAFLTPIMQLGLNGILVNEIIRHPENEGETLGTAVIMSLISGIFCILGLFAFVSIANAGETTTIIVCMLYSISMVAEAVHIMQYWYQAHLLSKYTALSMLISYIIAACYRIGLLISNADVKWFALSTVLDVAIIDMLLLWFYGKCGGRRLCFSIQKAKHLLSLGKHYILSNMMVVIFAQTDRIMLKTMLGATETGYYSAAAACACMTSFVFAAIIDSMRPGILESKKNNSEQYKKQVTALYSIVTFLSLLQCIALTALAPLAIRILYGEAYSPATNVLRIIVWYTTFSYLGAVRNVWILAESKYHLLWRVNLTGAVGNVFLNLIFIPLLGLNGAAWASLITQIVVNVVLCWVIKELRPTLGFLKKGLNVKQLFVTLKHLSTTLAKEHK